MSALTDFSPSWVMDEKLEAEKGRQLKDIYGQLVTRRLDELRPHPSYMRHHLTVPASALSALADRRTLIQVPLVITQDRIIVEGYERWEFARQQEQLKLLCIEYELTEVEALHWLLERHRRSNGLNDFTRILLALELEPSFRERARSNQRIGGQNKGSSKLTEAERLDVRSEIAAAAGVSVGNVSKVQQLILSAHSDLLQALRRGEIRIHRAWRWIKEPKEEQRRILMFYQTERMIKKGIRKLISRHQSKGSQTVPDLNNLVRRLSALQLSDVDPIDIGLIRTPGKKLYLSEELYGDLGFDRESPAK